MDILAEAGDLINKNVLEIGPGLGFLTEGLLDKQGLVTALEIDPRAIKILEKRWHDNERFKLLPVSILDFDLDAYWHEKPYVVIANIPYHITNPILKKLLSQTQNRPEFSLLMVQKEVGEKICITQKKKQKRSILSLSVEIFAEPKYCFTVLRDNFNPAPRVDSAIIKLTTRPKPLVGPDDEVDFFTVVNAGFSQKRKKLGNHIGTFFGVESNKLLGSIDPNRRAETLDVNDWITIMQHFQALRGKSAV